MRATQVRLGFFLGYVGLNVYLITMRRLLSPSSKVKLEELYAVPLKAIKDEKENEIK